MHLNTVTWECNLHQAITHPYGDHVGGLKLFESGKVWMQKKDYEYFTRDAWLDSNFRIGFDTNDVKHLRSVEGAGRLNLVDGDSIEIIPGITVIYRIGAYKGKSVYPG